MEKSCATCRHRSKGMFHEPCVDCGFVSSIVDGSIPTKWEPEHICSTCKHCDKKITEEPCLNCNIRMRNDKWEGKDE